jgi:hypothetical protein
MAEENPLIDYFLLLLDYVRNIFRPFWKLQVSEFFIVRLWTSSYFLLQANIVVLPH